ncbi:hypothetical protein ACFP82_17545 [Cellulomonas gelida]
MATSPAELRHLRSRRAALVGADAENGTPRADSTPDAGSGQPASSR